MYLDAVNVIVYSLSMESEKLNKTIKQFNNEAFIDIIVCAIVFMVFVSSSRILNKSNFAIHILYFGKFTY